MLISNHKEKSRGIIAFASNTETTDYISIAKKTCRLAGQVLNLPFTIINVEDNTFVNSRYDIDTNTQVQWKNSNRYQAFELSPYDETLVIDADYLILDKNINKIFDINFDYIIQKRSYALTQTWPNTMGPYSHEHVWATVFAFRKTKKAKLFFNLVERIQNNYGYYHSLFNIRERNYRNDFAFAIADIILNGYMITKFGIPGNMLTVDQTINSVSLNKNSLIIKDSSKSYICPITNLHIMSKSYLQSNSFDNFLNEFHEQSI